MYHNAVYSFLALDNSISWDICMGVGLDNTEDPYNMAAAAYYGVESLQVYVPEDHPYTRKDPQAMKDQIVMPVRSFFLRLRQLASGRKTFCRSFTNKGETSKV